MYKKSPQGWLKHWDFILLDIFCLQLAFVVAYLVRQGLENPYSDQIYRTVAFVFMLCQIVVMFLGQSYQDILKRGYYIEFTKTAKHVLMSCCCLSCISLQHSSSQLFQINVVLYRIFVFML